MNGLNVVTVLWTSVAAATLLLGGVHLARWVVDRQAHSSLAFAAMAIGFAGIGFTELWAMHASSPEEWALAIRWCHPPIFVVVVGLVAFVHVHLGTGRSWLAWSVIGLRGLILIWNFAAWPNFNYERVESIAQIAFLGNTVTVVDEATTSRWQFLGTLASLIAAIYVLDAALTLWRKGTAEGRRRAVVVGGSMLLFLLVASTYAQLVIYDVLRSPVLITPAFAVALVAMAYELSRDMLGASRLSRELGESRERLELAADAVDLGLWEWDGHANRVWATRPARDMFGIPESAAADYLNWLDRVDPGDRDLLVREMRRALETGSDCAVEFRVEAGGPRPRWIMARGRAELVAPGQPQRVRGVMRDVSERRQVEEQTRELRQELAHAGRVSMLGQIASSLAHELSQPLGAILRNVEAAGLLLRTPAPDIEELKAIMVDIERDDRRARDVIDRLRSMLTRRAADAQPIAPNDLIKDVLALVSADAAARGIALEHDPGPGLPAISGDRVQLSQVLLNLVLNAMDAVDDQPPDRRQVVIGVRSGASGTIELLVTDSGPGVAADQVTKVFEPFFTTKAAGMGMGLAISRTIAEVHGGTLTLIDTGDNGSTFRLHLPALPGAGA